LLWIGNAVSWTGDQFSLVASPWLVLSLTGSSIILEAIVMLAALPRSVLMLGGGTASDRTSRRRMLIATAVIRVLHGAAMALLVLLQKLHE
jgi:MFS family permease